MRPIRGARFIGRGEGYRHAHPQPRYRGASPCSRPAMLALLPPLLPVRTPRPGTSGAARQQRSVASARLPRCAACARVHSRNRAHPPGRHGGEPWPCAGCRGPTPCASPVRDAAPAAVPCAVLNRAHDADARPRISSCVAARAEGLIGESPVLPRRAAGAARAARLRRTRGAPRRAPAHRRQPQMLLDRPRRRPTAPRWLMRLISACALCAVLLRAPSGAHAVDVYNRTALASVAGRVARGSELILFSFGAWPRNAYRSLLACADASALS